MHDLFGRIMAHPVDGGVCVCVLGESSRAVGMNRYGDELRFEGL